MNECYFELKSNRLSPGVIQWNHFYDNWEAGQDAQTNYIRYRLSVSNIDHPYEHLYINSKISKEPINQGNDETQNAETELEYESDSNELEIMDKEFSVGVGDKYVEKNPEMQSIRESLSISSIFLKEYSYKAFGRFTWKVFQHITTKHEKNSSAII